MNEYAKWPDIAGRIEGNNHILPVRVYFEDTDFSGLVYHASYLRWCERGRSDFIRLLGIHHRELFSADNGQETCAFVVRHMEIDFLRPARIDDILEVVTACTDISGAVINLQQEVRRKSQTLVRVTVKIVLLSTKGKPQRLPASLRQAFSQCGSPDLNSPG
jgi:acyl-CoA thioester hydrolase